MGKLATKKTGRLGTRDSEEEKEASAWLTAVEQSGASSGCALVAVPTGGIAPATVSVAATFYSVILAEVVGSAVSLDEDAVATRRNREAFTNAIDSARCNESGSQTREKYARRRITAVGFRESSKRDSLNEHQESPRDRPIETGIGGGVVVRLDAGSSFVSSLDRRCWFEDVVRRKAKEKRKRKRKRKQDRDRDRDREYNSKITSEWRRSARRETEERRTIVEEEKEYRRLCHRYRKQRSSTGSEFCSLFGIATLAVAVAAMAASSPFCVPIASAVPMPSRENPLSRTGPRHDLDRSTGLEDVFEDAFEDVFREEDRPTTRTVLDEVELDIIRRSIAQGLGLEKIPDPSRANVSQAEYERAHREYLMRTQLSLDEQTFKSEKKLHVFPATAYPGNESSRLVVTSERERSERHRLFFPVEIPETDEDSASVDHATLRLLVHGAMIDRDRIDDPSNSHLDVLLYFRTFGRSRKLIGQKRIEAEDSRNSRWIEFDATLAVSFWVEAALDNLGLELEFLSNGEPVKRTFSSPVLNVFTATSSTASSNARTKRSSPEELMSLHKGRRTKCKGESKKCCRHELTVMFKDLKGFEFIVYPKTFDAGYCKGRCPPRYNPAHHHALLQSLLWKEDRKKVPKPCCAPSKLDQLMIVYYDENDSTQLKVSYWKNIQVLECACS